MIKLFKEIMKCILIQILFAWIWAGSAMSASMLSPEINIGTEAITGGLFNITRYEVMLKLRSENWVEARDAAEQIIREEIVEAEETLMSLLDSDKVGLLKSVVEALESIKSKRSVDRLIELFNKHKDVLRLRDVCLAVIDCLGQSAQEKAMLFLIEELNDSANNVIVKKRICRNLGFFPDRRAVEALIDFAASGQSIATQEAMTSLGYIADGDDLQKIQGIAMNIKGRQRTKDVEIQEREGFGDNADYFHWLFVSSAAEKIRNRSAGTAFVLGDVRIIIDEDVYLEAYTALLEEFEENKYLAWNNRKNVEYWKNPEIAARYIGAKESDRLLEKSAVRIADKAEHPDVQKILNVLLENNIEFHRSKDGLLMPDSQDKQLALWSKDGSVLMPAHKGYIPFAFAEKSFPVRGETVIFPGRDPLLLLSDSVSTSVVPLSKKFPDIDINVLPNGFVTYRLKNGKDVLIGTSHIDCVIERIPAEMSYDKRPIVIVDPRYYEELLSRDDSKRLLEKLKTKYKAKIVLVEKEEAYLNPANFIQLPDGRIIMNYAPKTISKLLEAGLKKEKLIVLSKPVSSLAPLKGMIGCLGGIYTDDRIPDIDIKGNALTGEECRGTENRLKIIDQSI